MAYSLEDLRKAREKKSPGDLLAAIPPDAPHDTDEAVGCWNGERFVSWREWMLQQPPDAFIDPGLEAKSARKSTNAPRKKRSASNPDCINYSNLDLFSE